MNQFITFALALFACVALSHCNSYAPGVHQVPLSSLSGLANIEHLLAGSSSYAHPNSYGSTQYAPLKSIVLPAASPAPAQASASATAAPSYPAGPSYSAAPSYPAAPSYAAAPSYGAAPAYPAAPSGYALHPSSHSSYGAAPGYGSIKATVQNAYATQLYPGQHNYRSYQSPPQYSTVALPIVPADPVAKLHIPQSSYGSHSSYSVPSASY